MFSKELTAEELEFWKKFLAAYSVPELKYAFETWQRNGNWFPHPSDIVEQVKAFRLNQERTGYINCDAICRARHGRGYHWNDMLWLWRRYKRELDKGCNMTPEQLLDELDSKREGGAPEWRRSE